MTEDWLEHIDNRKLVGAVLIDFSAAFDAIDHKLLLSKLGAYGFMSNAMSWLRAICSLEGSAFILMVTFPQLDILSVEFHKVVVLVRYYFPFLQTTCPWS